MTRPLRVQYPGGLYHVTGRGNGRQKIFGDSKDYNQFLDRFEDVVSDYRFLCHAYCLMPNHYHLLIETPEANLSKGLRQLNGVYSQDFNRRHKRVGHVFQGRFSSKLIEKDSYLLAVARYVVLNPVKAGLVKQPKQWRWSSYRATAGEEKPRELLETKLLLETLDRRSKAKAQSDYRHFIKEGMDKDDAGLPTEWKRVSVLGTRLFLEKIRAKVRSKGNEKEYSKEARFVGRPSLETVFGTARTKKQRNQAVRRAFRACGYSMKEISEHLGLHYATVSLVLRGRRGPKSPSWKGQRR